MKDIMNDVTLDVIKENLNKYASESIEGRIWAQRYINYFKLNQMENTIPISPPKDTCIKINVDYYWICQQVLKRCHRNQQGFMTDEAFIDMMMLLTRESEEKVF